jgi:uncharacterized repeat protein (TIGR03803 family)
MMAAYPFCELMLKGRGKMPDRESISLRRGSSKSKRSRRLANSAGRKATHFIYQAESLERRVLLSGLTTVASFNPWVLGAFPTSTLVADNAGNLYGTASTAGSYNDGTVFEWVKAANNTTLVASFNGANGADPAAGVVFDSNGNLYGTTNIGGAYNDGTVFEILAGSNTITTLASFNGADGANPTDSVLLDPAGDAYGTTLAGGTSNVGTIFEVVHGSGAISTLASFSGYASPYAGVTMDSHGNLFGTAASLLSLSNGSVYELPNGSNTIDTIASFNFSNGEGPFGGVTLDGNGNLYGSTFAGGQYNGGTIFEVVAGSNTITDLVPFGSEIERNTNPYGALIMDSAGNLFGTASDDPNEPSGGDIFELANGTNSITDLATFNDNGTQGSTPMAALYLDGSGNLFGTTEYGGTTTYNSSGAIPGSGTIFEIAHGTNTITTLSNLLSDAVYQRQPDITIDTRGDILGSGVSGSLNNPVGSIFEIVPGTNTITNLISSNSGDAIFDSPLIFDGSGDLYGASSLGGTYGEGAVSELANGSTTLTTLGSFNSTDSQGFGGGIAMDTDGDIFGTSAFYDYNADCLWELTKGSNTPTILGSVDSPGPIAVDSSGDVFGSSVDGGAYNNGTIFEWIKGQNTIATLASFNSADGFNQWGGVVIDGNGDLFGTTTYGGNNDCGLVFELAHRSNTITPIAHFNGNNGAQPVGGLAIDAAGNLFGTTTSGLNDQGTVFEVANGTNTISTLAVFNGINGGYPLGTIVIDKSGNLFGTTNQGGSAGAGTVFELPGAATVAPAITSLTVNAGAAQRSLVTQATIVFNQPVNLATGAISLIQRATGGGSPTPITFTQASSDNTTWNLTFPTYTGGSLPDGIFDLTVTAADVTSMSSPTLAMTGGDQTFTFDRLFGDADGNGIVDNADYFQFKKTYGQSLGSANYNSAFDYDANGIVNNADYFQFKKRYGMQIVIAAETAPSPNAALLSSSDSSSQKDKTSTLLL